MSTNASNCSSSCSLSHFWSTIRRTGLLLLCLGAPGAAGAWEHYGHDPGGSKFSPLTQINPDNVASLRTAWVYRTGDTGQDTAQPRQAFETTPVYWQGRLYLSSSRGRVYAIDASSGEEVWRFDAGFDPQLRFDESASRGVSLWHGSTAEGSSSDVACAHRVLFGTLKGELHALDALSGVPCIDFGNNGTVDLTRGVGNVSPGSYAITSPPAILGDTLFIGSAIGDNRRVASEHGIVRAIDVRSGRVLWSWDPVPRRATDPAYQTWSGDSADVSGGGNAWAPLSVDTQLGLVFVPTGAASPDFYGGHRRGDNLYTNSVVALDAATGAVRWHRQLVHHDVWDYDTPAQPVLVDLDLGQGKTPALVQVTKTGMMYVFDRTNGEPLIPVEERAVPTDGVPGEVLSPTQPFSTLPAIASHAPVTAEDAFGVLLFDKWSCARQIKNLRSDGIFTPPSLQGTLMRPGYAGGANWGGVAVDSDQAIAVTFVNELPAIVKLIPRDEFDPEQLGELDAAPMLGTPYIMARRPFLSSLGLPCVQPPWGRLVAMDLKNRRIAWERPLGTIADLAPGIVPDFAWGVPGMGGPLLTASGLTIIGAVAENKIRAIDTRTGTTLWQGELPNAGIASPMTYTANGRQYVVIAAGGHPYLSGETSDYLVAFALPADRQE